jgi:protein arginine N-methyltransferase 1
VDYSVSDYAQMIADDVRMGAYTRALERAVTTGSVVVDLGAGTGVMALLACRLGADRVFAIEPSPLIEVGREIARRNGLEDRIEFMPVPSQDASLPQRADVIVSDLRGVLPLYDGHVVSIVDARRRFLAPGGLLIPTQDTICAAVVEGFESYRRIDRWTKHSGGLEVNPARQLLANTWWRSRVEPSELLTEPRTIATLDYSTIEDPDLKSSVRFSVLRTGTAHGICVWFETLLVHGIGFTTAPGQPETVYGHAFMPLLSPVEVERGDVVEVLLGASSSAGKYVWRWQTTIVGSMGTKAKFRQSSALGFPISRRLLERSSSSYRPRRNEEAEVLRFVLELMDGNLTTEEIASCLSKQFPQRYSDARQSLEYVVRQAQERSH